MDQSAISSVLQEIRLTNDDVANIYHRGSWIYGTNLPTSDRDLTFVTRLPLRQQLKFCDEHKYFHEFELYRLWNQYDVCIYSVSNFEILLKKHYLDAVQCVFLPNEFKIKEEIDFRTIYLEKYYNPLKIKQAAFYEMYRDMNLYRTARFPKHISPSSRSLETHRSRQDHILKNLFHGLRYLDFAEQNEANAMFYHYSVTEFVEMKSAEFKSKLDALVTTNMIKGSFESCIIFDCSQNSEEVFVRLQKRCDSTKCKIIFIELDDLIEEKDQSQRQLMVSSRYDGEYPSIIKQIQEEALQYVPDFNLIGIKIKSFISNEGIPQDCLYKRCFWNNETNYFEFRYVITARKDDLQNIRTICQQFNGYKLCISHAVSQQIHGEQFLYVITSRFCNVGKKEALEDDKIFVDYLTKCNFPPTKVKQEFVVHDADINLDRDEK